MLDKNRLHGLDFLRALMMSLGLVLHTAQMYLTMPIMDYYWDNARSPSMDVILIFINTFRMPVFFLLSGFFMVLLLERRGRTATFKNRYKRIALPFLVFLPLLALIMTGLRIVAFHVMETGTFGFDLSLMSSSNHLWDNTHNLWFLYYLSLHVVTAGLVLYGVDKAPMTWRNRLSHLILKNPIHRSFPFFAVCITLSIIGGFSETGRISADLSFVPNPAVYLYFGLCFLLGSTLFYRKQDLSILADIWKRNMLTATVFLIFGLSLFLAKDQADGSKYQLMHVGLSVLSGFCVGYYMLAFVGLFSRYFQAYNPWVRYISDSSYWVFLFHSIPVVIIALLIHDWNVIAEVKFLVVCIGATLACWLTYQLFVRNYLLGEFLNGQRFSSVPWRTTS